MRSYYHVMDGEYDVTNKLIPPRHADTQRTRDILREHAAVAQKVHEQYNYPRFMELGLGQGLPFSAAEEDIDGASVLAATSSGNTSDATDVTRLFRTAGAVTMDWAESRAMLVDDTMPESSEIQLVMVNDYREVTFGYDMNKVMVIATLVTEEQPPLQVSRVFDRSRLRNRNDIPVSINIAEMEKAFAKRSPGGMQSSPNLAHYIAALLGADALYELCIAEHIRSGALTEQDFPIPEPTVETGLTETNDTVILPTGE